MSMKLLICRSFFRFFLFYVILSLPQMSPLAAESTRNSAPARSFAKTDTTASSLSRKNKKKAKNRRKKLEAQKKNYRKKHHLLLHENEVAIPGLKRNFTILFLSDTHLSLCDKRDFKVRDKAARRYEMFRSPDGESADTSFQQLLHYAKLEKPDLLLLGGDIVDSAMFSSIDFVRKSLQDASIPWIYAAGNHDFEYGKEYFSKKAFQKYLPRLMGLKISSCGYQITEFENFILFSVHDRNSQVSKPALKALKKLYSAQKPVILLTHVPLEPVVPDTLWKKTIKQWGSSPGGRSPVLLGPNSCVPNQTTGKFLDLVLADQSPVKLVLAGHIHFYHTGRLTRSLKQITSGAGYQKDFVKITLKPK